MRIYITDKKGHELSFDAPEFKNWNSEGMILVLEELVTMMKAKSVEDLELF